METAREYKTYTCSCGYKADVFGVKQKDTNGTYETHVCLKCKILVDCQTETVEFSDDWLSLEHTHIPAEPRCLNCDTNEVILWDVNLCKCPKCESKMILTRLELNIDQVGTIKIL
ncbi:MAG: hypothetical protein CFE24_15115 [Flavobacterium sp. BFFFF2]|nr:MAG: hypothetical protein CFE24_15115 [Flavobacterium sp. BFFFF2]